MTSITLAQANTLVDTALAKGRSLGLAPLTVVVLDAGGHMVALKREDRSGIMRVEIATAKAYGSLGMGFGSREWAERAAKAPMFVAAAGAVSQGRMIPAPGGVLIIAADGSVAGAAGVSGDLSDKDEECALAGIAAVGFKAQTGAAPPT